MLVRACEARGFAPRIRHYADDFGTVLALVAAGQGVSLVPELGVIAAPAGVSLIPLTARRRSRIAYRKGTRGHPVVAAFIAAVHAERTGEGETR
jgi:DNA-binding transcriptional LysR family regulator